MSAFQDITGCVFGLLTVTQHINAGWWLCRCACGNQVERRGTQMRAAERQRFVQSCGCRPGRAPVKYAMLYRGELRALAEVSAMTGVSKRYLMLLASEARLTEAWLDAHAKRRELRAKARAAGISSDAVLQRVKKLGWDLERACTQPMRPQARRKVAA